MEKALLESGYMPGKQLRPLILIRYRRYRFREPQSGISITYDLEISSSMIERSIARFASRLELQTTILEFKGGGMELPVALTQWQGIPQIWSAFSKYARCLDSHFDQPGSIGWLKT